MKYIPKRSGFASKRAFYRAFKKMTGYRAVEYIRRNRVQEKFGEIN
ncbi:hypothetical protein [Phocaeicola vulgatus]